MKYVAEWGTQCPQTRTFYAVSLFVPTTEADGGINLYFGSPASCIRRANEPLPPYTFYKIGAKIPATSFVAGEFKVEP